jgi:hypothetical protein
LAIIFCGDQKFENTDVIKASVNIDVQERLIISSEVELSDIFIEPGLHDQGLQSITHGGINNMTYFHK